MVIEVEGKNILACHDVGRKMKLWDEEVEGSDTVMVSIHPVGVDLHSCPYVDAPLTNNVIGDNNLEKFS